MSSFAGASCCHPCGRLRRAWRPRRPCARDTGPVFVVPSRPGVPIPINGRDASWSVVEGDIGLARPGHLTPVIIGGGRPLPPRRSYHGRHYYPSYGVPPVRGRYEIEPGRDRPMPEPAEPYFRSWSTSSDPQYSEHREPPRPRPHTTCRNTTTCRNPTTSKASRCRRRSKIRRWPSRRRPSSCREAAAHSLMPARPPRVRNSKTDADVPTGNLMSRRIAYLFATAGCLTFVAPAGADPECFDGVCRMPEVIELPQASAAAPAPADEPSVAGAAPQQASEQPRLGPAPEAGAPADAGRRSAAPGAPALAAAPGGEGDRGGNAAGVRETAA